MAGAAEMKRLYKIQLTVTDEAKMVLYQDHASFLSYDEDTWPGEIDIATHMYQCVTGMFKEYFEEERQHPEYWESQRAVCLARLADSSLPTYRRRTLTGALQRIERKIQELSRHDDDTAEGAASSTS